MIGFISFSQKQNPVDTNEICMPSEVARKILIDLNQLDNLKKDQILSDKQIKELELKSAKQDSIIGDLEQKDKNNQIIIGVKDEKFKLIEDDNTQLRKDIKKVKTRATIVEILSGAILVTITYIELLK